MKQAKPVSFDRRQFFLSASGLMTCAVLAPSSQIGATPSANAVYTPKGLLQDLPQSALQETRAVFEHRGSMRLSDPQGQRLARLKTMFSLVGDDTHTVNMTRHVVVPLDATPYPIVNELEFNTAFLTLGDVSNVEAQRAGNPTKVMLHARFTRVFLDPMSLEPINAIDIPALGGTLQLNDTQFAFSIPLDLVPGSKPGPILQEHSPWYEFGDKIHFTSLSIPPASESRPPRMDTSVWQVRSDQLMNPDHVQLCADYSYSASFNGSVFGWSGLTTKDPTRIVSNKVGVKVHEMTDLPAMAREIVLSKYPHRIVPITRSRKSET